MSFSFPNIPAFEKAENCCKSCHYPKGYPSDLESTEISVPNVQTSRRHDYRRVKA